MTTPSLPQMVREQIEARLIGLHTMLPGHVTAVDVTTGKCDVQPDIMRMGADGVAKTLGKISNCPIGFYRAGKAAVYLPLAVGDKVEIRFCERSLDTWLTTGGTVDPDDIRKHNLSDAVVGLGMYDFTDPPIGADSANVVMINDQGKLVITPAGRHTIQNPKGTFVFSEGGKFTLTNTSGILEMTDDGKFKFRGASDELLTVLLELVNDLVEATTLDPLTGPQPFSTDTITALQAVKTKLQGLAE